VIGREARDGVRVWLEKNEVQPHEIIHADDLGRLGLSIAPTLLIANHEGVVTDTMLFRLSPGDEERVWARLKDPANTHPLNNTDYPTEINTAELLRLQNSGRVTVLDIRSRPLFKTSHREGSVNIPEDELDARAQAELIPSDTVVIDCSAQSVVSCRSAYRKLRLRGFSTVYLFLH